MVQKRKMISNVTDKVATSAKGNFMEEDLEMQIVAAEMSSKVMKRPAGVSKGNEEDEDNMHDEEEELSEEEKAKRKEQEIVAERTQELKTMYMDDLKKTVTAAGLATGKKEDMIKVLLKHEAKARAAAREQQAKIRAVVVEKKQELESLSISQLGKLCEESGLKGVKAKSERIERLLVKWQEEDGVDKALARKASEERFEELMAMDNTLLRKMCDKAGLDPFVKEVLVDRVSKHENEMGRYARKSAKNDEATEGKKLDMVEALLANESTRKKEKELKLKKEEEIAKKQKELRSTAVEDLKKTLEKKGLEVPSKKEDMIAALWKASVEEEHVASRKSELKKMNAAALKTLVASNGLETGSTNSMVEAMLAHEAKCREELQAFELKAQEIVAEKKTKLESKSLSHLKDMCSNKGLAVGGGKEEKIERLLEEAQKDGEVDKIVSAFMRSARKDALGLMDKSDILKICEKQGIDPYVKAVMAERISSYEEECSEPVTKKARKAH